MSCCVAGNLNVSQNRLVVSRSPATGRRRRGIAGSGKGGEDAARSVTALAAASRARWPAL